MSQFVRFNRVLTKQWIAGSSAIRQKRWQKRTYLNAKQDRDLFQNLKINIEGQIQDEVFVKALQQSLTNYEHKKRLSHKVGQDHSYEETNGKLGSQQQATQINDVKKQMEDNGSRNISSNSQESGKKGVLGCEKDYDEKKGCNTKEKEFVRSNIVDNYSETKNKNDDFVNEYFYTLSDKTADEQYDNLLDAYDEVRHILGTIDYQILQHPIWTDFEHIVKLVLQYYPFQFKDQQALLENIQQEMQNALQSIGIGRDSSNEKAITNGKIIENMKQTGTQIHNILNILQDEQEQLKKNEETVSQVSQEKLGKLLGKVSNISFTKMGPNSFYSILSVRMVNYIRQCDMCVQRDSISSMFSAQCGIFVNKIQQFRRDVNEVQYRIDKVTHKLQQTVIGSSCIERKSSNQDNIKQQKSPILTLETTQLELLKEVQFLSNKLEANIMQKFTKIYAQKFSTIQWDEKNNIADCNQKYQYPYLEQFASENYCKIQYKYIRSVALSDSGFIIVYDDGFYKAYGDDIPMALLSALREYSDQGIYPKFVAIGPNGYYYCQFSHSKCVYKGPQLFEQFCQQHRDDLELQCVAFTEFGYVVVHEKLGVKWDGIPNRLKDILLKDHPVVQYVSIAHDAQSWYIRYYSGKDCFKFETMQQYKKDLRRYCRQSYKNMQDIEFVTFGPQQSAFVSSLDYNILFSEK
eukprot:TRINITY_DN10364_c0_g1_i1.p1 TRINITY_DN10364_c0_g1~~TRINITY_DN10364_c0_g1_i1.p1  ORF type:complete len:764 (+),score=14.52 TRINITY_DN10364_c0_g1_i1:226-2292(+)